MCALAIFGGPFIRLVLTTNYFRLYASYEFPPPITFDYYRSFYGWVVCAVAITGFAAGIGSRSVDRHVAIFALLYSFAIDMA